MERIMHQTQFDFEDAIRNTKLGDKLPKLEYLKTGTTICGLIFDGGVAIAADTRSTAGTVVMDRNCKKIHYIADRIYCCGAGTAADTFAVTDMARDQLKLLSMKTGREPLVQAAGHIMISHLFRYGGGISAALVLGGVDYQGAHLLSIDPSGFYSKKPYCTLGSGSLAARQVLDLTYKPNMTRDEAIEAVTAAITAGIINDEGSGSNVDICIITKDGVHFQRSYKKIGDTSAGRFDLFQ